jgi:hypothetical protein
MCTIVLEMDAYDMINLKKEEIGILR